MHPPEQGISESPEKNSPEQSRTLRNLAIRCYGPLLVTLAFVLLTWLTWRKWPDILIDFGRELYVPWQLVQGKVLYRDLAYLNGPFSPYLNCLWFQLFGTSLLTLVLCNLVLLGLFTWMIYYLVRRSCNDFTATLTSITFLTVFAFGHLVGVGNYNFICPYSHEMTHGIILFFVIILLFTYLLMRFSYQLIVCIGFVLGLIFLGKGEIFTGAVVATLAGLALTFMAHNCEMKKIIAASFILGLFFLTPLMVFATFLSTKMPMSQALLGLGGTWVGVLTSQVSENIFYKQCLGLDRPGHNIFVMARQFTGTMLLVSALVFADGFRKEPRRLAWLLSAGLLILATVVVKKPLIPWILTGPALPLSGFCLAAGLIWWCVRHRTDRAVMQYLAPLAIWSVFGLGLLAKIFLNTRLYHYGFALAMPATLMIVVGLVGLGSQMLAQRYHRGDFYRFFIAALIIADIVYYLIISFHFYGNKSFPVGRGVDVIMAFKPQLDPRSEPVSQFLRHLETISDLDNFQVLPEGIMLNYLARKPSPNRYYNFMPPEVLVYGEDAMLQALGNAPPKYLALIPKDTKEYGFTGFGQDPHYGERIMAWIELHYELSWQVKAKGDEAFDLKLLKRKNLPWGPEQAFPGSNTSKRIGGNSG